MERQKSLQPRLRILLGQATALGPGKAELLEAIQETGSISAAARRMGMSYRRAWTLVDNMNTDFVEPVIQTNAGGKGGGGASVTPLGEEVIRRYRIIEEKALDSVADEITEFGFYLAE
ncbi:MAG: LysR family transcriptional regulator [Rhodospirillaceae bacterium]